MTFFPLPDEFHSAPEFLGASDAAVTLYARSASWSAGHTTDGHVPTAALPLFTANHEQAAAELVDRGVWRRSRGGFQFAVWPKECTKAYVEAKREAWRRRQANYRSSDDVLSRRDSRVSHAALTRESPRESRVSSSSSSSSSIRGGLVGSKPAVGAPARSTEPPLKCPQHEGQPDDGIPCGPCGDARRARDAWDAERVRAEKAARSSEAHAAAQTRALAIASCDMCDAEGYRGRGLCTHDPDAAERAARGRALVDAERQRRKDPA